MMLARHAKLWVHAPHSQSFRACAYIKIVFLLFYSRNGLRRKGGTARSQVQLIHALLPLDVLTRGPRSPSKSVEKKANDSLNCLLERSCSFKSCFEIMVSTFSFVLCSELSTRYEFTQESSSSAKQEVDQLKEEVKVMSAQLLRQHNASLDSQVRSIYFIT